MSIPTARLYTLNYFLLPFLFILHQGVGVCSGSIAMEMELRRFLFWDSYDPLVRPVVNISHNVTVWVDMSLNHVIDLDERIQILHSEIWIRLEWYDPRFTWAPSRFGHVGTIHVHTEQIWAPDIGIYNEIGPETSKDPKEYLLRINAKGSIFWTFPRTVKISCKMDMFYFPFDSQNCSYTFGSWAYVGSLLDVVNRSSHGDTTAYMDNGEWLLLDILVERQEQYYPCCPDIPFTQVSFTVVLQRRYLFYVYNLICPCMLITLLHLASFLLPAESGEKITLNVTILLGLSVFLLLVAEITPPQSEVIPVIGQYFGACILLVALSTALSVFILHLHFRGPRVIRPPLWIQSLVIGSLGRILCYGSATERTTKQTHNDLKTAMDEHGTAQLVAVRSIAETTPNGGSPQGIHPSRECTKENRKDIIEDWKTIALVLDRILFFIFLLANMAAAGFVFSHIARTDVSSKIETT